MATDEIHISEIRRICENSENGAKHWFKPDTLRFFRSRLPQTAYVTGDYAFFVSSEQFVMHIPRYHVEPRRYTVRRVDMRDGTLSDVGEFQKHATRAQAMAALKRARAAIAQEVTA